MEQRMSVIRTNGTDAKSKPRGRPLKEKENPAADLQRARVRRAQKAFRLRKEQYVTSIEEKCRDLESVVEEMGSTFMSFSDSLLESRKVDPEAIRNTMEKFLRLSERAARDPGEESAESSDESGATMQANDTLKDAPVLIDTPNQLVQHHAPTLNTLRSSSNLANPSINYLWGVSAQSPTDGSSAIPYILAGRDSFACLLYFETIVLATRALRGEVPREIEQSIFRYKLRYANRKNILRILSGVINVMLHGTSQLSTQREDRQLSSHIPNDDEGVKASIMRELESKGDNRSDYLSSWEVETYLKTKWSLGIDSAAVRVHPYAMLEAASDSIDSPGRAAYTGFPVSTPTLIPGFLNTEQQILSAPALSEKLSKAAVSIGAGPRWHYADVDMAVQSLSAENVNRL